MQTDPYRQKQSIYGGFDVTYAMSSAATTASLTAPALKSTSHKLYVQRITVYVVTGAAGKTLAIADASGTVPLTPALDMGTGGVTFTADYGPVGRVLTVNELIKLTISAAGAVASIRLQGYSRT